MGSPTTSTTGLRSRRRKQLSATSAAPLLLLGPSRVRASDVLRRQDEDDIANNPAWTRMGVYQGRPGATYSYTYTIGQGGETTTIVIPASTPTSEASFIFLTPTSESTSTADDIPFSSISTTLKETPPSTPSSPSSSADPLDSIDSTNSEPSSPATTFFSSEPTASDMESTQEGSGMNNRTLVITLSTVLSVIGFLLIVGAVLLWWRYRRHHVPLFSRGITPIDDDEIEAWKTGGRLTEKGNGGGRGGVRSSIHGHGALLPTHKDDLVNNTQSSPRSPKVKKPASVIVYTNVPPRASGEGSPRSPTRSLHSMHSSHFRKQSIDVPQTPVFAKAPNARVGLCDESLPGADPFVSTLKRQPSRLSKMPRTSTSGPRHMRTRSSRSSIRSFGYGIGGSSPPDHHNQWLNSGYHTDTGAAEFTPRTSADYFNRSRTYTTNVIPPRLSLDEPLGGLSPPPAVHRQDIGRAIG